MRKEKPTDLAPRHFVPGRQYRGVQGKVVDWVEDRIEEGLLYIPVRLVDNTELSGDFKQLRVFVRNQRDWGV